MNMFGGPVKEAYQFEGPAFPKQTCYIMKFTSTYDAIERLILPPPLKVDRTQPPEVLLWYFSSPDSRGPGGQVVPYQGIQFRGYTERQGVKGIAGWEFVDGLRGDFTTADIMGAWGMQFGMMKKYAQIRFTPIGGDEFDIIAVRHGITAFRMTIRMGVMLEEQQLQEALKGMGSIMRETFVVREIPNLDWTGYTDRCIASTPTAKTLKIRRAWGVGDGTVEFPCGGLVPLENLSELSPRDVQGLLIGEMEVGKDTFLRIKLVENLE